MEPTISFFGLGYVGLTTATCLSSKGFKAICYDIDKQKVNTINQGKPPFYEPNLSKLLLKATKTGLLTATTNPTDAVLNSTITFITVGTPSNPDNTIDLTQIENAAKTTGKALQQKTTHHTIIVKSTVLPTTTQNIIKPTIEKTSGKRTPKDFGLCVNPEFLREGNAVQDTLNPDRIIIGETDKESGDTLESLYQNFYSKMPPIIRTTPVNAELIKYANNAFLSTKITFANSIANLCQKLPGADITTITKAIGLDKRIGPLFLNAGLGWGGSCFPKDLKALSVFAKKMGTPLPLIDATLLINHYQPLRAIQLTEALLGKLKGKKVAVLGLSFKPDTDDIREAVSIRIINELLAKGARITAYDPAAMHNAKRIWNNKIELSTNAYKCIQGADCSIIVTEWKEFAGLEPEDFTARMRNPIVIDGRRVFDPNKFSEKLTYVAIGLGTERIDPLEQPDEYGWLNPALSVNAIIQEKNRILLVKRKNTPFKNQWSLPGGYVEYGETVENALKREIKEECGLYIDSLNLLEVYSSPERHPSKHVVTLCYSANTSGGKLSKVDEVSSARFFRINEIPETLAFDHTQMINDFFHTKK
ncbi:MAG: nucleotide sugar dehydrogenase [Thaumarchaeota archaeon]|nr:nucleotide sugar dehydrogenase [Nitrososphaerota archaeon]